MPRVIYPVAKPESNEVEKYRCRFCHKDHDTVEKAQEHLAEVHNLDIR